MWIVFAILTVLCWGTSETIFKSSVEDDDESLLKLFAYNGIILGICAVIFMLVMQVPFDIRYVIRYAPIALIYLTSMYFMYKAMPLLKISILSPISNSSCALTSLLCIFVLHQTLSPIQAAAVITVIMGIILLSINKEEVKNSEDKKKSYKIYIIGILLAVGYWLFDGIGSFLDDYILGEAMSAEQVIIAFSFVYFISGIISYIILKVKDRSYKFNSDKKKLIGSLFETAGQYFYIYTYSLGNAAIASPFIASYSIVTLILSRIFLKEKLTWKQYLIIAFIIAGMLVLSLE